MPQTHRTPAWTFADQASTYRFWALIFAGVFVALGAAAMRAHLTWLSQSNYAFNRGENSLLVSCWIAGNLLGVLVGLLLTQSKSARAYCLVPLVAGALGVGVTALGTAYGVGLPYVALFWGRSSSFWKDRSKAALAASGDVPMYFAYYPVLGFSYVRQGFASTPTRNGRLTSF
ncbi:hypothetical protein ACEPUM_09765 [Pseudomonas aeruginosa]